MLSGRKPSQRQGAVPFLQNHTRRDEGREHIEDKSNTGYPEGLERNHPFARSTAHTVR
jgi:hypothetical protein